MARWQDVVAFDADFARAVKDRFDVGKHKFLATLRSDGSPRISGIEATFNDGDVWLGMMPGSLKLRDLQRDARFALHSASPDADERNPAAWQGDAKVAGVAVAVTDPSERARAMEGMATGGLPPDDIPLLRLDLREVVFIHMGEPPDHIVIELWQPEQPLQRFKRK